MIVTSDPPCPVKTESEVTLICSIVLSHILADVPILEVTVVWTGPLGTLTGSDAFIAGNNSLIYTSTLLIYSAASNENYTCRARVDSGLSSFTSSQVKTNWIFITTGIVRFVALVFQMYISVSSLAVDVVIFVNVLSGTSTAGEPYALACTTMVLGTLDEPSISWLDSSSEEISTADNGARVISDTTMKTDSNISRFLSFNPLTSFDAGLFTCHVAVLGITETRQFIVTVKSKL